MPEKARRAVGEARRAARQRAIHQKNICRCALSRSVDIGSQNSAIREFTQILASKIQWCANEKASAMLLENFFNAGAILKGEIRQSRRDAHIAEMKTSEAIGKRRAAIAFGLFCSAALLRSHLARDGAFLNPPWQRIFHRRSFHASFAGSEKCG